VNDPQPTGAEEGSKDSDDTSEGSSGLLSRLLGA
jgi:hypothetical protein